MKKIIGGLVIVVLIVSYYLIEEQLTKPDSEQEKLQQQALAEAKFYKKLGEEFSLNNYGIIISNFDVEKRSDSTILTIQASLTKLPLAHSVINSAFFKIRDEKGSLFYPQSQTLRVGESSSPVSLRYALPPVTISYFLYRLVLEGGAKKTKSLLPYIRIIGLRGRVETD